MNSFLLEIRGQLVKAESKLELMKTNSLDLISINKEFAKTEKYLNEVVFTIIDSISEKIKLTEDIQFLKELHFLYGFGYRLTMLYLNYKIHKLSGVIDSQIIEQENNLLRRRSDIFGDSERPRPYAQETLVHRTINSYEIKKVPAEPWDPPGQERE
jgi:hypothetical protein